jgi:hypothetical protein
MPKRFSRDDRPKDINQLARHLVQLSTEEQPSERHRAEISRIMSEMGEKGGKIGGKRRLETLTPERRREIALSAARARWSKKQAQSFSEGDTVEYIDARTKEVKYGLIKKMYGSNAIIRTVSKEEAGPNRKKFTPRLPG